MRLHVLLAATLVAAFSVTFADTPPDPIVAKPLSTLPVIDGKIEPGEWDEAGRFEGLKDQDTGDPLDEDGEFWLAADKDFVYFAARMKDREPSRIQASEYRTNVSLNGNDTVTLLLDAFGTLTDFNSFSINPRGATNISIAGGRAAKREWLGEFSANARVTEAGWEAEAKIPWSVMRLPEKGIRTVRFNVSRNFVRRQRSYRWAFTQGGLIQNNGRWENVQIPSSPPRTLKLLPYATPGSTSKRAPSSTRDWICEPPSRSRWIWWAASIRTFATWRTKSSPWTSATSSVYGARRGRSFWKAPTSSGHPGTRPFSPASGSVLSMPASRRSANCPIA